MGQLRNFKFVPKDAGNVRHSVGSFQGSTSYATGGEPVRAQDFGLALIYGANNGFIGLTAGVASHQASFVSTDGSADGVQSGKIVITQLSDGAQVPNTTNLSAVTFNNAIIHGR